jgi:hypothetical protein
LHLNAASGFSTSQFAYYTDNGTSADDTYCPYVFSQFGYTSASRTESITDQMTGVKTGTSYAALLTNEIQLNERPCILSGYQDDIHPWYLGLSGLLLWIPSGEGHSWVCDGSNVTKFYSGFIYTYKSSYKVITTQTEYSLDFSLSYLHMNWGWVNANGETDSYSNNLTNDGWYDCTTNYTQADSQSKNFPYFQTIIYNIHP